VATPSDQASVPVWVQLGIDQTVFDQLPPAERLRLEREHHPQPPVPVHSRRPVQDYKPSAEEQTELDAITDIHARTTRYRQMRDAQQQP
jgi:hypothetical protein